MNEFGFTIWSGLTMTSYSTETWRILLPEDWEEKETSNTERHYFESPCGEFGFYISCWQFDPEKYQFSNTKALESVGVIEKKSFLEMEGYEWVIEAEERDVCAQSESSVIDAYAENRSYRIVCKSLASLPWVVRSSFHDYNCKDWIQSREQFKAVIDSVEIHSGNP